MAATVPSAPKSDDKPNCFALAERVIAEADVDAARVAAVGVGSPGFMDTRAGVVIAPPNLPGWRNVPLKARMEELTGMPVTLVNDANAAAWGEFWAGAGKDAEDLATRCPESSPMVRLLQGNLCLIGLFHFRLKQG